MPPRPARPCVHPGCAVLVYDGTGRCPAHRLRPWNRRDAPKRITGRRLQRLRRELFERRPLCSGPDSLCERDGIATEATIRDHAVALALGGADTEDNVQPLCLGCNEAKRVREAQAGRQA